MGSFKSCSRCGKIVPYNHKCNKGKVYKQNDIDKLRSTTRWTNKSIEIREASNYLCSVCLDNGIYNLFHNSYIVFYDRNHRCK